MCHQADTAPAFLFSEQKKQVEEVLRVDPKNLNSYVGVVNQPPPKWSSVKKWLLHINYAPGYAPEPEQKPVCRQFSRCEGCPYPAHGFLCWGGEDDCMRTRVKKLNEKELEHEDQSGFVYRIKGNVIEPIPSPEGLPQDLQGKFLWLNLSGEAQSAIRQVYVAGTGWVSPSILNRKTEPMPLVLKYRADGINEQGAYLSLEVEPWEYDRMALHTLERLKKEKRRSER